MKLLRQFLIILLFTFVGEILKMVVPLPIPASIYGMVLLFIALMAGVIKLDQVREASRFLIEIMPVMFIPAGVGVMTAWGVLSPVLLPVSVITVVTIFTVMLSTGQVSQFVIRRDKKKGEQNE